MNKNDIYNRLHAPRTTITIHIREAGVMLQEGEEAQGDKPNIISGRINNERQNIDGDEVCMIGTCRFSPKNNKTYI